MARLIVFGTGSFAQVARFYFDRDSEHEPVAYAVDEPPGDSFDGLPLHPFAEIAERHPPDTCKMFVAVAYGRGNHLRAEICARARALGYELVTYVCSKATAWGDTLMGDNCFVFEDNTIQPFVTMGDGVVLWSGNHIGHHARLGDYVFVTSHVVIAGHTSVGDHTFLGVNATLRDGIAVGRDNTIGAGALIMKSTADGEVYVPARTQPRRT